MDISDEFRSKYSKRFGTDVQIAYAGSAYDTALLIAKSFKTNHGGSLLEAIKRQSPLYGMSGIYKFNESAQGSGFDPELVIKEIDKKGIKVLD